MAEPTAQELVDICNNFMLSSPPGEFMEVVTDIRGLLSNEAVSAARRASSLACRPISCSFFSL